MDELKTVRSNNFTRNDKMKLFLRDFIISCEHKTGFEWWVDEARRILKDNNKRIDNQYEVMQSSPDNPANYGPTCTAENVRGDFK